MVSDGQVSRGSEAQVSASMVLESKAKNHRVSINQACCQDLGGSRGSEAQVSAFMVLESKAKKHWFPFNREGSQGLGCSRMTLKSLQVSSQSPRQQKS